MKSRIQCFMLERTTLAVESLRRYSMSDDCPKNSFHTRSATINESVPYYDEHMEGRGSIPSIELKADPRWPTHCDCGYEFEDSDEWQHNLDRLYRMPSGALVELCKAPAGAMSYAEWYSNSGYKAGPDGNFLMVMLPPGGAARYIWNLDLPGKEGARWTRNGVPPNVTASPSIMTPHYHGWLRGGYLEEC